METVIYGDVLVAVNFIMNLVVLRITEKLTGISVRPFRRYLGAFAGALCSFVIFLPLRGFWPDVLVRLGVTAVVMGVTYGKRSVRDFLRLAVVFFCAGALLAGLFMALWFFLPQELFSYANGILYLDVEPLALVGCLVAAYLFVLAFDRVFDSGNSREGVWLATVRRNGKTAELPLFLDTGNHLTESFSGLPVVVAGFRAVSPLLTHGEQSCIRGRVGQLPAGLRPVFYNGVGANGLLYAFRPDSITLRKGDRTVEGVGYLAVSPDEINCQGCSGIFGSRLLGITLDSR